MTRRAPGRSPWWSRSRGLPDDVYRSWLESWLGSARPAILAWGQGPEGYCIAGAGSLAIGRAGELRQLGWHQIERGGWDVERSRLTWTCYDAELEHHELTEPGRVPEVFGERVTASIAMQKFVPLTGERGVVVTARRDLATAGPAQWHATLTGGLRWESPGVREAVDGVLAEVRTEYDLG